VDFHLDGRLRLEEMISSRIGLGDLNEAFERMRRGEAARQVVVFD
jgi:Zn-dependent alcohol dehydrogenase